MVFELIKAIVLAGLPIAAFSYYLIMLTRKKTLLKSTNVRQLQKELKTLEHSKEPEQTFWESALQRKFLTFGGGFYGIVTLITYLHIELYQIAGFIGGIFEGKSIFSDGIVSLIIAFFIDLVKNLITAFIWPTYWFEYLPIGIFWIWLIVAILAHSMATKYALAKKV